MNENFKLSEMARNELESDFNVIRSVPAKMSRREMKGWIEIVLGQSSEYPRICNHYGDEKLRVKTTCVRLEYGSRC